MKNRNQKIRTLLTLLVLSPFLWLMGQTSAQFAHIERYLQETEIIVDETLSSGGLCPGNILIPLANDLEGPNADDLKEFFDGTVERFRAWEGLYSTGLRTDISWLTRASQWLGEGGEFVTDAGTTWFRKNGENVFEVKNGGILPNQQVHYDRVGAGTPVGDVVNGYQVVKVGDDIKVRRVPDETPYTGTSYLDRLTDHPDAHVLERHGHDVTDDALTKRATTGIAPDGSTTYSGNPPPYSSKFASSDKIKDVLDNVGPGSPNWNPPSSGNYAFDYPISGYASTPFGYGIPSGGGSTLPMNRVKVVYKKDGGVWKLLTMYPQP